MTSTVTQTRDGREVTREKDGNYYKFFLPDGTQICGARNQTGFPCMMRPVKGRNRCYLHGGRMEPQDYQRITKPVQTRYVSDMGFSFILESENP